MKPYIYLANILLHSGVLGTPIPGGRNPAEIRQNPPPGGTPTTTGPGLPAGPGTPAPTVQPQPPNPTETYYNSAGVPESALPSPYTPAGGLGTTSTEPRYMVESDYDFESVSLALYQEYFELDLFNDGLARFTNADFAAAGLGPNARSLIEFMANQESGHATLLTNMLGPAAPKRCLYNYPYRTVREWMDFCQRVTRFGESGAWGFLSHLDSREVAQLLSQSVATEARQQLLFRQMSGLTPMDVWFENAWPQSWTWTMLAPYITSCPAGQTRLSWQNFPRLRIMNNPNINRIAPADTPADGSETVGVRIADPSVSTLSPNETCQNVPGISQNCAPGIARNRSSPLSFTNKTVFFEWEPPGIAIGPNNTYMTSTEAGQPTFVGWSSQLNMTYSPLRRTGPFTGFTQQPDGVVYDDEGIINGTMVVMLTDADLDVTPFNVSLLNPHIVALGLYMAG